MHTPDDMDKIRSGHVLQLDKRAVLVHHIGRVKNGWRIQYSERIKNTLASERRLARYWERCEVLRARYDAKRGWMWGYKRIEVLSWGMTVPEHEPLYFDSQRCVKTMYLLRKRGGNLMNLLPKELLLVVVEFYLSRRLSWWAQYLSGVEMTAQREFKERFYENREIHTAQILPQDGDMAIRCELCNLTGKFKCDLCAQAYYCSREEQRKHWLKHARECDLDVGEVEKKNPINSYPNASCQKLESNEYSKTKYSPRVKKVGDKTLKLDGHGNSSHKENSQQSPVTQEKLEESIKVYQRYDGKTEDREIEERLSKSDYMFM